MLNSSHHYTKRSCRCYFQSMAGHDTFANDFSDFLYEYAEEVTNEFDRATRVPLNISLPYFESVIFLHARTMTLLPYFAVPDELVEQMSQAVRSRLIMEFSTVDPDRIITAFDERLAEYARTSEKLGPFGERWYHATFAHFRDSMASALEPTGLFIWNIGRTGDVSESPDRDGLLEVVHQAEIHHIVPFQRLVINFFNFQAE